MFPMVCLITPLLFFQGVRSCSTERPNVNAYARSSLSFPGQTQTGETIEQKAKSFPLEDVELTDGPFLEARERTRAYLLSLDPDALLYHMRLGAALPPKAESGYGGWDVHCSGMAGHYLSACSLLSAAAHDMELKNRVAYMVHEMAICQSAYGDGGIHTDGWPANVWYAKLAKGELMPLRVNAWYNTHKIMAGLRDAWIHLENEEARTLLLRMADWAVKTTSSLTESQWQEMLDGEHGAPHEILADAFAVGGNPAHIACAKRFRHEKVFQPMCKENPDVLYGLHANTQIPKFIGYQRIYELTGEQAWGDASSFFWETVVKRHTWSFGGNSQWERFFDPSTFEDEILAACGPETCNTYNMLKLTKMLWCQDPQVEAMDYYERALYNHILSSNGPAEGAFYYTPARPGHYRAYSMPRDSFWCCVGTGMENPGKYGEMIYGHGDKALYVNLFVPSILTWKSEGIRFKQSTRFPVEGKAVFDVRLDSPKRFTLLIRSPYWTTPKGIQVRIDGVPKKWTAKPGRYLALEREWRDRTRIHLTLPMRVWTESLPHSEKYASILYGPLVLGARLGRFGLTHEDFYQGGSTDAPALGALLPLVWAPTLKVPLNEIPKHVNKRRGRLVFPTRDLIEPKDLTLVPFYQIHQERYCIYWEYDSSSRSKETASYADNQRGIIKSLQENTIDCIHIADRVSELNHALKGNNMATGTMMGQPWRHAIDGGFVRYTMRVAHDGPTSLVCTYWGSDGDKRTFDILVDDTLIATESLRGEHPGEFTFCSYEIPEAQTTERTDVAVTFKTHPENVAGGIYGIATLGGRSMQ